MATNKSYSVSRKKEYRATEYIEAIRSGNRFMLAQALTLLESKKNTHRVLANEILQGCLPFSGNAIRLGITGVPGVGKSTFIESFGELLVRKNKKIAILAVDPSSSLSKGSILGDKTRMDVLSNHANAFIRPTPSSGTLGGVAQNTRESMILCEAAGYDYVIIETVGVGQSETEVAALVDCFILLMLAGAGDDLQGVKRGIMEMAQLFVINKSDGENTKKAKQAELLLKSALHLFPVPENNFLPEVYKCSATDKTGLEAIESAIEKFISKTKENGSFEINRTRQNLHWFDVQFEKGLVSRALQNHDLNALRKKLRSEVETSKLNPFEASELLLNQIGLK
ncbi:MAG: methylmalonyl Co-A mutase-associated GTPase MeaB [Flavobacteriales bacterium]|nr:methylmalonyl Co-A mutase-associated GTPase MeaB [Flavobacteriales bacterium]